MTNQQGAPEALRHADGLESFARMLPAYGFDPQPLKDAAATVRSLHAIALELADQLSGKNERLAALVEAQQPAPSAAAALPEGWVPLVITHEGQYPEEVAYGPQILMDRLGKWLRKYFDHVVASKAQPSPTPQADSQPAPQGETNVQLDTDSNHSAPGQQRDVVGTVALGQPVGHGSDATAGDPSAQGDKLLTVAERNIRSFLRSAVFKSESDREAALNCVDVLWAAARAPADSVTAPAGGEISRLRAQVETLTRDCGRQASKIAELIADLKFQDGKHREDRAQLQTIYEHQRGECWYWQGDGQDHLESLCNTLPVVIRADQLRALVTTPPAQAADSVLEDAALLRYACTEGGANGLKWLAVYERWDGDGYFIDALRAAYKHDAARKQGGKP